MILYFIAPLTAIYKLTYISLYFTFHFGHILISTYNIASRAYPSLYIPFWSYSNVNDLTEEGFVEALYIPFWSYSNHVGRWGVWLYGQFTFHFGHILMVNVIWWQKAQYFFTFHPCAKCWIHFLKFPICFTSILTLTPDFSIGYW